MRKLIVIPVAIAMLISLGACSKPGGRGAEELALLIRTDFIAAERLVMLADITADYGDRVYDFGVKYTSEGAGGANADTGVAHTGVIELLSPDSVAGITAEVAPGGYALTFDGARLDTGALTGSGMSPLEALPVLLAQWREGYIKLCGIEKLGESETVAIETDITESASQKTWFDAKTLLPLRAELYENGVMVIACAFNNVALGG